MFVETSSTLATLTGAVNAHHRGRALRRFRRPHRPLRASRAGARRRALYDSIHDKILRLGDDCIVWPAHGAGSVCGQALADRDFSTIGYERRHNPMLAHADRDAFIAAALDAHLELPPYFHRMEAINEAGATPRTHLPVPPPIDVEVLAERLETPTPPLVLDVREPESFAGSHVPGAMSIPCDLLPSFAGWLLAPDAAPILVADGLEMVRQAVRHLARAGFADQPIVTLCSSGRPATIAASILLRGCYTNVLDSFGSMAAGRAVGCPMAG